MSVSVFAEPARAQSNSAEAVAGVDTAVPQDNSDLVTYSSEFFDRYQPNTALDMVRQLPGFQLDDGDDKRGFGGAAGNLLINDRYVSAKQDKPSAILARIPASRVRHIELVRGQVRDIDLRGRPNVANLVLAEDGEAATRWEASLRKNFSIEQLTPSGSISVADRWRSTDFNIGVDARKASYGDPGTEDVYDGSDNLIETRVFEHTGKGFTANGYFNASRWVGQTLLALNTTIGLEKREEELQITGVSLEPAGVGTDDFFISNRRNQEFELGMDAERSLRPDLLGRAILLYFRLDRDPESSQRSFDPDGNQTLFRQADTSSTSTESIARLEFDWTRFSNHNIKANIEAAKNVLDSSLVQIVDEGDGPEVVPVPGANTRVEELRAEFQVNDTWTFGNSELLYGLGGETSTISQTGDAESERNFVFLKPQATYTYSPVPQRLSRLRLAREVSQLDFKDFVSSTVFEDDDIALGNPDLRPESTWVAELSQEWRFGEIGVVKITGFYHWITDVEDLLPLTPEFEAPGNIGDGRRWGIVWESTLPLDDIGLKEARLDIKVRLQDSQVVDPVTGEDRVLSSEGGHSGDILFINENQYAVFVDFRQDFEDARIAWGWDVASRAERPLFKVNEFDVYDEGTEFDAFIETTRWWGIKTRLSLINILDLWEARDRTVYEGERGLTPVAFRELRNLTNGARVMITLSGGF